MIFAELPLDSCLGAMLAHSRILGGRRIAKGSDVTPALLETARADGIDRLWVARLEAGDVAEAAAARRLAAVLAGAGTDARDPVHGRVNVHARHAGLLLVDRAAIAAANAASEAVGIATLTPYSPVAAGELVATLKVIPFAMPEDALAAIEGLAPGIMIEPWRPGRTAALLQTLDGHGNRLLAKTVAVTRARLDRLSVELVECATLDHAVAPLAAALAAAAEAHPLLLVAGASATADRRDVVPAAIMAAGGRVERVGMPVDPGNLLVLGALGDRMVIGLPGCARSSKRNGLDLLLERWAAGLAIAASDIGGMGVGGLLEDSGRPVPWAWQ